MTTLKAKQRAGKVALATENKLVEEGAEILTRIGKGAHLEDWLTVGAGLYVGVKQALKKGERRSSTYNEAMREWLDAHPAYDETHLDKDTRASLINLYSTHGAVEALRADLKIMTPGEKMRMASPRSAWDRIKHLFVQAKPKRVRSERGPSTVTELEGEVGQLQTRLAAAIDLSLSDESLREAIALAWKDVELASRLRVVHAEIGKLISAEKRKGKTNGKEIQAEAF